MKTKEQIMIDNCLPDGGLLPYGLGKQILSAMQEYANQQWNEAIRAADENAKVDEFDEFMVDHNSILKLLK